MVGLFSVFFFFFFFFVCLFGVVHSWCAPCALEVWGKRVGGREREETVAKGKNCQPTLYVMSRISGQKSWVAQVTSTWISSKTKTGHVIGMKSSLVIPSPSPSPFFYLFSYPLPNFLFPNKIRKSLIMVLHFIQIVTETRGPSTTKWRQCCA